MNTFFVFLLTIIVLIDACIKYKILDSGRDINFIIEFIVSKTGWGIYFVILIIGLGIIALINNIILSIILLVVCSFTLFKSYDELRYN
jgi:hypothetical protein